MLVAGYVDLIFSGNQTINGLVTLKIQVVNNSHIVHQFISNLN